MKFVNLLVKYNYDALFFNILIRVLLCKTFLLHLCYKSNVLSFNNNGFIIIYE